MEKIVYSDDFIVAVEDPSARLFRVTRNATPYINTDSLLKQIDVVRDYLRDHPKHTLLLDMRNAPLRNDPAFEAAAHEMGQVTRRFHRTAVLVRTAVGGLQARRMQRERGSNNRVFDDEAAAIAYLLEAHA